MRDLVQKDGWRQRKGLGSLMWTLVTVAYISVGHFSVSNNLKRGIVADG